MSSGYAAPATAAHTRLDLHDHYLPPMRLEFKPKRSTAHYCGDACRKRASRGKAPSEPQKPPLGAFLSVTGTSQPQKAGKPPQNGFVTLKPSIWRGSKAPSKLDRRIAPDAKYPGMYRIRKPDGTLTDMVNLTRGKDALAQCLNS